VATLRAFEDKCKRLYDVRLTEYAEKTAQQMGQYEEQLLQVRCLEFHCTTCGYCCRLCWPEVCCTNACEITR
jgi:hypothetical protein